MSASHAVRGLVSIRPGRAAAGLALVALVAMPAAPGRAEPEYVTAEARPVSARYDAYGRVEPVAALPVRTLAAGTVTGLEVRPGAPVQAGQRLATLDGPEVRASLAQADAAVTSARARLAAAEQTLAVQREQLPAHLTTRQAMAEAESAVTGARADLAAARAQGSARRQMATLAAPVAGTVLAVTAASGEAVLAGQIVLTLEPAGGLWLRAAYYGAEAGAIRVDMTGRFAPADGAEPIPVRVVSVFGVEAPDGGEWVGLEATAPTPRWRNGAYGTVTLDGPTQTLVAVPTRALILDQGQWWVLVHTAEGDQRREVVPGPARGELTFLERGLEAGAEVVVANAYLRFHEDIARNYQPPD